MGRDPDPTHYAALGLRPGATASEVRDAYRELAKQFHPDRNPGDPAAKARFQQISDSYALLRGARRPAAGSLPARPRAPRPGTVGTVTTVADLQRGSALWVRPDGILVAPDRTVRLRPSTPGSMYPSVDNTVRVDCRADGFHVFMPPQPSMRWPLSAAADTGGLAVAALWVGDRQEDHGATAPRMPLRLLGGTIAEMTVDERGWASMEALTVDPVGHWFVDGAEPLHAEPHPATPLRVMRDAVGYWVHSELPPHRWTPGEQPQPSRRVVVAGAILGGIDVTGDPGTATA